MSISIVIIVALIVGIYLTFHYRNKAMEKHSETLSITQDEFETYIEIIKQCIFQDLPERCYIELDIVQDEVYKKISIAGTDHQLCIYFQGKHIHIVFDEHSTEVNTLTVHVFRTIQQKMGFSADDFIHA